MVESKTNVLEELQLKQKQLIQYYILSVCFILLFYSVINYLFGYKINSFVDLIALLIIGSGYFLIGRNYNFELSIDIGLGISLILVYIQVLIRWKAFPIVYLWFFSIPISVLMLKSYTATVYWSIAIVILALSPSFVSSIFNIEGLATNSNQETLIMNLSVVFFNIYLTLFFLYYLNEFNKYKLRLNSFEKAETNTAIDNVDDIEEKEDNSLKGEVPINPDKINKLFETIEKYFLETKSYRDPNFNINKLAVDLDTSITNISKAVSFKKAVHFKVYLNSYRINEIKQKLDNRENEKFTLKHIYTTSGFSHQSTFNRVFKEIEGVTPSEYIDGLKK